MMFFLMCTEKKGNETSACKKKKINCKSLKSKAGERLNHINTLKKTHTHSEETRVCRTLGYFRNLHARFRAFGSPPGSHPTQIFIHKNVWKATTGHVCSSGEDVLRCLLLFFFLSFFDCKLCSALVNHFNSLCTSQRLNSHCVQDETNRGKDPERRNGGC